MVTNFTFHLFHLHLLFVFQTIYITQDIVDVLRNGKKCYYYIILNTYGW